MAVLTRDDLIDVLRRTMDPGWLDAILADPDSAAALNAMADVLADVSAAGQVACDNTTISNSAAGRGGASNLTLTRSASGTGGVIPQGYAFADARGIAAVAISDTTVGTGVTQVTVPVVTVRKTELVNTITAPQFVIQGNRPAVDSGGTNALVGQTPAPAGYPPIVSTTFTVVAAATPIVGGASDWLAAIGRERGQLRQSGESDGSFRLRVRNVPDAVSPVAVSQAAAGAASHGGLPPVTFQEPFNDGSTASVRAGYQIDWFDSLFFGGAVDSTGSADQAASTKTDFMEDIQPDATNLKPRETVSLREASCYFRETVPGPLPDTDSERVFFDDDGYFDDQVLGYLDVREDGVQVAALMAVWEECNRKRAAGVRFDEYVEGLTRISALGSTSSATPTTVFTATPPTGKVWWLRDGHFGWDAVLPVAAQAYLQFTFEDSSTYTTPAQSGTDGVRVVGPLGLQRSRITQVAGILSSDSVNAAHLVANLVVLEVVA